MEQCTVLNKSVRYGDVDFVLKAETGLRVFQNRGFRQTYDFKNPLLGGPSREQNQIVYRPIAFNLLVATARQDAERPPFNHRIDSTTDLTDGDQEGATHRETWTGNRRTSPFFGRLDGVQFRHSWKYAGFLSSSV